MVRFIIFASLVSVALMIYTMIECSRSPKDLVRSLPKPAWFVIILLPLIGAILWFILGRPQSPENQPYQQQSAPDDDEDFLRQLEVWRRQQQREAEYKAREQELKDQKKEQKKTDPQSPADNSDSPASKESKPKPEDSGNDTPDSKA